MKNTEHNKLAAQLIVAASQECVERGRPLNGDWCDEIIERVAIAPAITELTRECEEQARLLGMGSEREAKLRAKVAELENYIYALEYRTPLEVLRAVRANQQATP